MHNSLDEEKEQTRCYLGRAASVRIDPPFAMKKQFKGVASA